MSEENNKKNKDQNNEEKKDQSNEQNARDENPIDSDKVADNPHTLGYAHSVGGAVIKPEDKGKIKGRALSAMSHQTDQQLGQIHEQIQLLAEQAKKIKDRKSISERIYMAEIKFEPLINHTYHLYETDDEAHLLSMIAPDQWGRSKNNYTFIATVKLLADHTWDVVESADGAFDDDKNDAEDIHPEG